MKFVWLWNQERKKTHPGRLTAGSPENTIRPLVKENHLNQTIIFRFYVNLQGCIFSWKWFAMLCVCVCLFHEGLTFWIGQERYGPRLRIMVWTYRERAFFGISSLYSLGKALCFGISADIVTLPETNSSPLKIGKIPKGNDHIPTASFFSG